jgi:hypothetical protein
MDAANQPVAERPPRWPIYLVVGVVISAIVIRLIMGVATLHRNGPPPGHVREDEEGLNWSFTHLLGYLREREVPLAIYTAKERAERGPMIWVCHTDNLRTPDMPKVIIQKRPSMAEAREAVAIIGDESFSWGLFFFTGNNDLLRKIRQALP